MDRAPVQNEPSGGRHAPCGSADKSRSRSGRGELACRFVLGCNVCLSGRFGVESLLSLRPPAENAFSISYFCFVSVLTTLESLIKNMFQLAKVENALHKKFFSENVYVLKSFLIIVFKFEIEITKTQIFELLSSGFFQVPSLCYNAVGVWWVWWVWRCVTGGGCGAR